MPEPRSVEHITVGLIEAAVAALHQSMERRDVNEATIVNQAVQLYDEVDKYVAAGGDLIVRTKDGEMFRLRY